MKRCCLLMLWLVPVSVCLGQAPPYDVAPEAVPPYYRVRYPASTTPGELIFPASFTVWVPEGSQPLRGVIVHQHGCGEGSCRSGLTGAFDLHWQALARKHHCALLAPVYEQPQRADCQMWCDPRNGSSATFLRAIRDLSRQTGHPELATVPWALWGHSGGGHWCGGMVLLHPERVAAAWLRSGVPLLKSNPDRPEIKPHTLPAAALHVPMMCNPGTKEGVTDKSNRFARVWPANLAFFSAVRGRGGLLGVAIDPLTAHECGNQRYLAIRWLDECLRLRLPDEPGQPLRPMPTSDVWLAEPTDTVAVPADQFEGDPLTAAWIPGGGLARLWMQYRVDTRVEDTTPPPAPSGVQRDGRRLTWTCTADPESGLAHFIIQRDGRFLARLPAKGKNPFGRPVFQGLQYSDTPLLPLAKMQYDLPADADTNHTWSVIAVNTVGLKSAASSTAR